MSNVVKTMITSIAVLAVIGIAAFVVVWYINGDNNNGEAMSIKKIKRIFLSNAGDNNGS